MPNQSFAFKQFSIDQDKCAMKVGTDAVLLGSWIHACDVENILDIGTGTGIIALMIAQKSNSTSTIDAIDIDKNAFIQAKENANNCKWKERINIYYSSFQNFSANSLKKYQLIVSNPPYFVDSSKSSAEARTTARHTDLLSFEELIEGVLRILDRKGKFCVILPSKEGELFKDMAENKYLYLTKLTRVKTTAEKPEKRLLMQFELERKPFSENSIIIEKDERHSYTDEYKELTKDYYPGF